MCWRTSGVNVAPSTGSAPKSPSDCRTPPRPASHHSPVQPNNHVYIVMILIRDRRRPSAPRPGLIRVSASTNCTHHYQRHHFSRAQIAKFRRRTSHKEGSRQSCCDDRGPSHCGELQQVAISNGVAGYAADGLGVFLAQCPTDVQPTGRRSSVKSQVTRTWVSHLLTGACAAT